MSAQTSRTPRSLSLAISRVVEEVRLERGLTVEKVGELAGVSKPQASKLLAGGKAWTVNEVELVASGLGMRPSTLIRRAEQRSLPVA